MTPRIIAAMVLALLLAGCKEHEEYRAGAEYLDSVTIQPPAGVADLNPPEPVCSRDDNGVLTCV